jgi:hypothetical protein
MVDTEYGLGEETIGEAKAPDRQSYSANRGRFDTRSGRREILEQGLEDERAKQKTTLKARSKPRGRRLRRRILTGSLALATAAVGVKAILPSVENAVVSTVKEDKTTYKIGQRINPDKIYEVNVITNTDEQGNLIEPVVFVKFEEGVREISLNDPHLSPFNRRGLKGSLYVEQGNYEMGHITNPDYKGNLAEDFNLPADIRANFNRIPVEKGLPPRAVFLVPAGVMYRINDRDFSVFFPLSAVQPPLSS